MQLAHAKVEEIEDLLGRLSDVNDSLSSTLSGAGDPRAHTLARHRDILHDYMQASSHSSCPGRQHGQHAKYLLLCLLTSTRTSHTTGPRPLTEVVRRDAQEFRRLQAALGAARDRAELFAGSSESSPLQQGASSTGLLLRERGNLQNTNSAVRRQFAHPAHLQRPPICSS
jgi:Golgi SNAP receptor complex protein 1